MSHATPMLALSDDLSDDLAGGYAQALSMFAKTFGTPKSIVVVSSTRLGQDDSVSIFSGDQCFGIHDFSGFPEELYSLEYNPPGDPELAGRIAQLFATNEIKTSIDFESGLSHEVWIPLRQVFPEVQIPVIPIKIPRSADAKLMLRMGQILAPLRDEGVLILGVGAVVNNPQQLIWHGKDQAFPWAKDFEAWVKTQISNRNVENLSKFQEEGPQSGLALTKPESFLPLLFVLGAARPGDRAAMIQEGIQYGSLSLFSVALQTDLTTIEMAKSQLH